MKHVLLLGFSVIFCGITLNLSCGGNDTTTTTESSSELERLRLEAEKKQKEEEENKKREEEEKRKKNEHEEKVKKINENLTNIINTSVETTRNNINNLSKDEFMFMLSNADFSLINDKNLFTGVYNNKHTDSGKSLATILDNLSVERIIKLSNDTSVGILRFTSLNKAKEILDQKETLLSDKQLSPLVYGQLGGIDKPKQRIEELLKGRISGLINRLDDAVLNLIPKTLIPEIEPKSLKELTQKKVNTLLSYKTQLVPQHGATITTENYDKYKVLTTDQINAVFDKLTLKYLLSEQMVGLPLKNLTGSQFTALFSGSNGKNRFAALDSDQVMAVWRPEVTKELAQEISLKTLQDMKLNTINISKDQAEGLFGNSKEKLNKIPFDKISEVKVENEKGVFSPLTNLVSQPTILAYQLWFIVEQKRTNIVLTKAQFDSLDSNTQQTLSRLIK